MQEVCVARIKRVLRKGISAERELAEVQVLLLQGSSVAHEDESNSGVSLHEFTLSPPFWGEPL
jgi:hypothetical protein